jgi:hypothetical protein
MWTDGRTGTLPGGPAAALSSKVSRWLAGKASTAFRQRHGLVCETLAEEMGFDLLRVVDDRTVEVRCVRRRIEAIRQLMGALAPDKFGD